MCDTRFEAGATLLFVAITDQENKFKNLKSKVQNKNSKRQNLNSKSQKIQNA